MLILGWRPSQGFITNTVFHASAGHGVNRGWEDEHALPDFMATNSFSAIANCRQTTPMPISKPCPTELCP